MKLTFTAVILLMVSIPSIAKAADRFIPAGMPIGCWMQEKDLSLKTAEPGDPVLCYLSPSMDFGRPLFPRGSYLTGRIEGGKAPGRLHGKGTLIINFDREASYLSAALAVLWAADSLSWPPGRAGVEVIRPRLWNRRGRRIQCRR